MMEENKKKIRKKKVNKNAVEESRFQTNKFLIEKDLSDSRRMGAKGWIEKDFLFLLEDRDWIHICLVKRKKNILL